ncbi:MAG: hypothetical protein CL535_17400 [Ahrensia sp.]|nr:hypothetical protein [Ahrensia sp.]
MQNLNAGQSGQDSQPPALFISDYYCRRIKNKIADNIHYSFHGVELDDALAIATAALQEARVFARSSETAVKLDMIGDIVESAYHEDCGEACDHVEKVPQILSL